MTYLFSKGSAQWSQSVSQSVAVFVCTNFTRKSRRTVQLLL